MNRTLVIGGTLFIGRALVARLLERGDEVVILHRGRGTPFGDAVREIRCDRNDARAVEAALRGERFDVVIDNVYDWERGTTAAQVEAAARACADGLRRYVFTSSIAAYGSGVDRDEDSHDPAPAVGTTESADASAIAASVAATSARGMTSSTADAPPPIMESSRATETTVASATRMRGVA